MLLTCDLLIAAAFEPELDPLVPILGSGLSGTVRGIRIMARPVGIGLPLAAAGISNRVTVLRPRAVLMIGSCGAYPSRGRAIGDVVAARTIHLVEPAVVADEAGFPRAMSVREEADAAMSAGLAQYGASLASIATTLAVTTSATLSAKIAERCECDVEHLEAFAGAAACSKERIAFTTVLGVANIVGPSGREQWKANGAAAHSAAVRVVMAWLDARAPGLALD